MIFSEGSIERRLTSCWTIIGDRRRSRLFFTVQGPRDDKSSCESCNECESDIGCDVTTIDAYVPPRRELFFFGLTLLELQHSNAYLVGGRSFSTVDKFELRGGTHHKFEFSHLVSTQSIRLIFGVAQDQWIE